MTVYLVISLPPCQNYRIYTVYILYMVLANPMYLAIMVNLELRVLIVVIVRKF
jgi:hypothetical protein